MRKPLMVVAVSAALTVAAFAASSSALKSTVTVGDFAVKVTKAMGAPVATTSGAVQSLRSYGVRIGDANARLTEGEAARILADLGVRAQTTNPTSAITSAKADQLAAIAGLASSASTISPDTDLPTQCLDNKNRGLCNDCCNAAVGCDPSTGCGRPCAKFCQTVPPPGQQSPSDPTP